MIKKRLLSCCGVIMIVLTLGVATGWTATYQYDGAGRLIKAEYSATVKEEFSYDKAGNVTKKVVLGNSNTITASCDANGKIEPSGAVTVTKGSDQKFTITPNDGYAVKDVLVDGASAGAVTEYTFTAVSADHTIAASFAIDTATLTMKASPAGSGSTDPAVGAHSVTIGEAVSISAAAASGYKFVGWSCSAACSLEDAASSSTKATLTGDGEVTASFAKDGGSSSLALTYPNGGEVIPRGGTATITWASSAELSSVKLELVKDGSVSSEIVSGTENDGSYDWTIPEDAEVGKYYKIKITGTAAASSVRAEETLTDESDGYFSIVGDEYLILTSPVGGETLSIGDAVNVTWQSAGIDGTVDLVLYKNGTRDGAIATATENDGAYEWTIPAGQTAGTDYRVKIASSADSSISDQSAADFSIVGETSATLTMAASPTDGGTTDPEVGEHTVETGVAQSVEATAAEGYKFVRWRTNDEDSASIASPTDDSTSVTLLDSATVTAVFAVDDSESGAASSNFAGLQIKINAAKENADSVNVVKGGIPSSISSDGIDVSDFAITLMIDDYKLEMTEETGTLKQKGDKPVYSYSSGRDQAEKVKLVISLIDEDDSTDSTTGGNVSAAKRAKARSKSKRFWSCRVSKASLGADIDCFDGVDVYLDVNGDAFGDTLDVDEKTRWVFKKNKAGDNSETIDVTGTPMEEFDVLKADGKRVVFAELLDAPAKDTFGIKKGVIDALEFDPTTDVVTISVDDWEETLFDDDAWNAKSATKALYKSKDDDGVIILLYLDFDKQSWKFQVKNIEFYDDIDASDGIDVKLRVGDYEGGVRLDADQITTLKYPPKEDK